MHGGSGVRIPKGCDNFCITVPEVINTTIVVNVKQIRRLVRVCVSC